MSKTEFQSKFLNWYGIVLILEIGMLHIMTAQGEYEEAAYMGYLFAVNFFGSLVAAFGIYHRQFWGWMLGLVIAAGSVAGYVWSRTLGMPQMNVEEWITPYGVVSISVECIFILLTLVRPWKIQANEVVSITNPRLKYASALVGLLVITLISVLTYRWDADVTLAFGHHVGTLDQVCGTPATTFAELEEKYGVRIALVANSMMGSIVDVRLVIVNPDKAHALLNNQAALLLNQEALILAPHMHSHGGNRLRVGKVFTIFFPAQKIHPGSSVSLVFGPVRVEPVIVR